MGLTLGHLIKTASFYGHGLPYKPREILRRLGVEGRVLIVGSVVRSSWGGWWQPAKRSGWIRYIKLW